MESSSSHPISKSLQRAYGKEIDRSRVSDIQEISGNGVTAKIDGVAVAAGNGKLMDRLGIPYINCHSVGTIIHMAIDGRYAGHIVISDIVKPHAKEAIAALKKAGIHKTVMLTGDTKAVADKVASELGIDEVYSELLPAGKVEKVRSCCRQNRRRQSSPLSATASTTRRCWAARISASRWAPWARTLPSRRRTWC